MRKCVRRYRQNYKVMYSYGSPNMTFQVKVSLATAKALISDGSSSCSQPGPDAVQYPVNRTYGVRAAGGGQAAVKQNLLRRKFPAIHPLRKSRDGKSSLGSFIIGGSPNLTKDDRLEAENNVPEENICGRHFLFDKKYERLERTRTVIPPLPRDYHVHRSGNLHHFSLPKELSHSHAVRPFPLGSSDKYDLNTSPAFLFPSALVLNGRNTLSVDNCKFNRPKVNYRTCNLFTIGDIQKSHSYPDPMVGASRSFIHRLSELSSLEGETVRQEKLKKIRKTRKHNS